MKYILTEPLHVHIIPKQREELDRIKKEILEDHNVKIPISELARQALKEGIPIIDKNRGYLEIKK
jgi:hypothetical protein